jgi:hypothetical protein
MIVKPLVPQAFWFRFAIPCNRVEGIPGSNGSSGELLALPEACALPEIKQLDHGLRWAQVRLGWNPQGLGITVIAEGVSPQQLTERRPEGFATAQFWVDTRDTRNVSRATRFCHRFVVRIERGQSRGKLEAQLTQRPVSRAVADAPLSRCDDVPLRVELSKTGWLLELFLPGRLLTGFDPDTNRRLGFAYQIADLIRDDQYLGIGRDFPIAENPSLWTTLELRD